MSAPLLRVSGLTTCIDTGEALVTAVDGISFEIARGETFALLGESGCGKSMTALSILRLLPDAAHVAAGRIEFDGTDLLALPEAAMRTVRGRQVAMIFQEPAASLNPVMTVGAQIAEVLARHTALAGSALDARVLELLDAVRIPEARRRLGAYPFELSGGLKQRVMIAIALACDPALLVADEPTTALDVTIQAQILELLRELQRARGLAMLLITHDLAVVAETAHRVGVMYAGELVEVAARDAFFRSPSHPYSRKLFASLPAGVRRGAPLQVIRGSVPPLTHAFTGCRFADRCDFAWARCRTEAPPMYATPAGSEARCHLFASGEHGEGRGVRSEVETVAPATTDAAASSPAFPLTPHSSLLTVEDLQVHFPIRKGLLRRAVAHVRAVDGISLTLAAGRTLALVGESGCGKTTVGKGLLRLVEPTGGRVLLAGEDWTRLSLRQLRGRRRAAQIVFQDPYASLNPRMRVAEIIAEGMRALGVGSSDADRQARVDRLLEEVGLGADTKYRYPHEFSGGQRQRIAIARALAVEPQLLVCDEPTSALDVSVQAQILNLLKGLQERRGLAYLFITHNLAVVEYLAHDVAVMYLGRIVESGSAEEVLGRPRHPYTQALLSAVPQLPAEGAARRPVIRLPGDLPSPVHPPAGCHFHPRCPQALPQCAERWPRTAPFSATHRADCHLYLQD
ncbi:MAG: dipeptide ABC transporter ATP-binding protein [Burkholderiales bacterium]